jgi:hypothetical protein
VTIIVTYRKHDWPEGKYLTEEYQDDRLQELLDRACVAFGNPSIQHGGPSITTESSAGSIPIPKRRRKK